MRDPYATLGVSKSADQSEIKSAFRKLAKKYHPDQNANDPKAQEKFAAVNTAYEILGDKDKKAKFDRGEIDANGKETGFGGGPFGNNPFGGGGFARDFGGGGQGPRTGGFNPEDIFSEIFGGRKKSAHPFGESADPFASATGASSQGHTSRKGTDVEAQIRVPLEALASEEKVKVTLPTGKTVSVSLPKGVENGQVIRLKGQGYGSTFGGKTGDALVNVQIIPHSVFQRDGDSLRLDLPVTLYEAVLGAKITVPTLGGQVSLGLPKGSSSGKVLRIKGRGIIKKDGTRGDILARILITLPQQASQDLETMMKVWQEQRPYKVRDE